MRIKLALVGRSVAPKIAVAWHLEKNHHFERKKMMATVNKMVAYSYMYQPFQRYISWEKKIQFYDALYSVDSEIHLTYLFSRINKGTDNVVVEDCRYLNEVEALRKSGFKIIRITPTKLTRPRLVNAKEAGYGLVPIHEWFGHDSNRFPVDYSLTYTSKEQLAKSVDHILERMRLTETE